jgi:4,4'-diaponeurosporenoate glycosyltransferase
MPIHHAERAEAHDGRCFNAHDFPSNIHSFILPPPPCRINHFNARLRDMVIAISANKRYIFFVIPFNSKKRHLCCTKGTALVNIVIIITGLALGALLLLRLPHLKADKAADVRVSVIIPARNEAQHIPALIADLKAQSLTPFEIICVDDGSEDTTAAGACVVSAGVHPDGWVGKTWASQVGAQSASGELLLFLDADVRFESHALQSLAALQQNRGGVVSVQPYHTVSRLYEHFSMFFNVISVAATGAGMPLLRRTSGMFGPLLLLPRALYMAHGGHAKVKSRVLEDFCLGRHYEKLGIPVSLRAGRDAVTYRMYPDGPGSLWQGWTKNFFTGAVSVSVPLLLMCIVWLTALTAAAIDIIRYAPALSVRFWLSAGLYALCAAEAAFNARQVGNFRWPVLVFYPVFLLGFHVIFLASAFKRLVLRRVTWKGRSIRL